MKKRTGKKCIINRGPRVTVDETKTIIDSIPVLNGMFTKLYAKHKALRALRDPFEPRPEQEEIEVTESLQYLSRLSSGRWGDLEKKYIEHHDEHHNAEHKHHHSVDSIHSVSDHPQDALNSRSINSAESMSKLMKRRRIALSLATLASKRDKLDTIVKDGAISAIIEMSTINDMIVLKSCASAFSLLAKEPHLRKKMHEEGALQAILSLAVSPNALVRTECIKALANLMCEDGYESKAVRDGLPHTLLKIVDHNENIDSVLTCLLNLTCVPDKYTRIEEVTDTMLQIVAKKLTVQQESYVLKGLANLSALKSFQQRLLEDGCMAILDKAMKQAPGPDRIIAGTVVRNLTTCYRTRPKLLDHNIITMLVSMSRDELEEVKFLAVKALYNLSRDASCRERIVAGNAVTVILKISRETGGNIAIGRLAAKTLRVLCGDESVANKLVGDGIVKALMSLLRNDDPSIQQYCAESICSLFQIDAVLGKLIDQGAVGVVVSLSQTSTEFITGEWCSFALYYLATNRACPEDTLEQAILPCLIKLTDNSSPRTKYFISSAFAYITLLKSIDSSEAIPRLVKMLEFEKDVDTKNNCITSLYNSADLDENCYSMLEAGVLEPLLHLTESDNVKTRIECAAILCRLSLQVSFYEEFERCNVLRILLKLSSLEHILTQRRVIIGLSNLSANERLRQQLFELNPIPYIIPLASKRDENLRRGCVSIVCNLSAEYGNEKYIVEAGIVPTLLITAMISSDQIQTKVICVKALVNLMSDPSQYKAMVDAGAVWGFSSLATQPDSELLQMCARALCCLSSEFAESMLESSATVKTAIFLIQQKQDLELQRIGGRCILNLLLAQPADSSGLYEDFRIRVVKNVHPLAENGDEECGEMTIHILCKLSAYNDCTEAIVSSGMLRKIDSGHMFGSKSLSIAYLTMFGNIASNFDMRTKILNDRTIDKFASMCLVEDAQIDFTVVKTVYALSCAENNIPILANNTLGLLYTIWNADHHQKDGDVIFYILGIIYNLSTGSSADQFKLVSQGVVDFIAEMWPRAILHAKTCLAACNTILHLGCGNTNTTRMVDDGATPILCFIADKNNRPSHTANFGFTYDMQYRVSAAMRNMLCVSANQKTMVGQGCIHSLMAIAAEAEKASHSNDPVTEAAQQNCSAALRSLTYNAEVRHVLKDQGAIDFIMAELAKEDTTISYDLLVEVEAESWSNGARGTNRDGRAAHVPTGNIIDDMRTTFDLTTSFDDGSSNKRGEGVYLEKYHVKVELDEPEIEASEYNKSLKVGISDLETIVDPEENAIPTVMLCPKQACDVEIYSVRALKTNIRDHEDTQDLSAEFNDMSEELSAQLSYSQNLPELKSNRKDQNGAKIDTGLSEGFIDKSSADRKAFDPSNRTSGNTGYLPEIEQSLNSVLSWGHSESQDKVLQPKGTSVTNGAKAEPKKIKKIKHETPTERFDKLLGCIKAAKKGALPIGQVVDQWTDISRF